MSPELRNPRAILALTLVLAFAVPVVAQPPFEPPLGFAIEATTGGVRLKTDATTASFTSCEDGETPGDRGSIRAAGEIDVHPKAEVWGELHPHDASGTVPLEPPADLEPGGDLVLQPGEGLTLAAGDYLFGDVVLKNDAVLTADGTVRIFFTGSLDLGPKSRARSTTGLARDLAFHAQGGDGGVRLQPEAAVVAVVHAPGLAVTLGPRSRVAGVLVGAEVELQDAASVLFDEALEDGCGPPPDATPPELVFTSPLPGLFLTQERPELVVRYADFDGEDEEPASGVDVSSLAFTVDGTPWGPRARWNSPPPPPPATRSRSWRSTASTRPARSSNPCRVRSRRG